MDDAAEKTRVERVQADLKSRNLGLAMMFLRNRYDGKSGFTTHQIADGTGLPEGKVRAELNAAAKRREVHKDIASGGNLPPDRWQYKLYGQERDKDFNLKEAGDYEKPSE